MDKLKMVKTVGGIVISVGVNAIISNLIKCTTPSTTGTIKKVCIGIGGFVLASMVGDDVIKYSEDSIDKIVSDFKVKDVDDKKKED